MKILKRANQCAVTCLFTTGLVYAVGLPPGFQDTLVFGGIGFDAPAAIRFAPDGRVFVAERSGLIKIFDDIADTTPTIFADLRTQVYNAWDRGLLGLAIDPDFPASPYVYVLYSHDAEIGGTAPLWGDQCPNPPGFTDQGCVISSRLARLEASGDVMIGSETVLIEGWCQQFPSHSAGDLHFTADGALLLSHGEGAHFNFEDYGQVGNPCGDPPLEGGSLRAQDILTPGDPVDYHGALLRVDPMTGLAMPDNPLVGGDTGDDDPIIAHGLRNPFRFTLRGDEVWIGDVGWGAYEEIDRVASASDSVVENFGWPCYEGPNRQPGFDAADLPICEGLYAAGTVSAPYYAYDHSAPTGSSISGLVFYEGDQYPPLYQGALFFCDFSAQWLKVMPLDPNGNPDANQIIDFSDGPSPVDMQIGPEGDVFYVNYSRSGLSYMHRIQYFPVNLPPVAVASAGPSSGTAPLSVQFDASASYDPDPNDTLAFAWDLNGDGIFDDSTALTPTYVYTSGGTVNVRLRVTDNHGASATITLSISVDNSPPIPTILTPLETLTWRVGEAIEFTGSALDPDSGLLADTQLDWEVTLFHCELNDPNTCHQHFVQAFPGTASGQFTAVDHEYPSFLEIELTATDAGQPDWWDPNFAYRQRIAFAAATLPETVTEFPVLVRLTPARFDYAQADPLGADLRFVWPDGTPLSHEVSNWDPAGESTIWVKTPQIEAGSTGAFMWLYYGAANAANASAPADVWSQGFAAVYHCDESGGVVLQNPGFEDGLNSWTTFGNVYAASFAPRTGLQHLKMFGLFNGISNVSQVYQEISTTPGETWELDCYTYHQTGDAITGTANQAYMYIMMFDSEGNYLSGSGTTILTGADPENVWIDNQPLQLTAPELTTTVRAILTFLQPTGSESGAVYYDDVSLSTISGTDVLDATLNQNDAINNGAPAIIGQIVSGYQFGNPTYLDAGSPASLMITGELTLEAWAKIDNPNQNDYMRLLSKKSGWDATAGYELEYNPALNILTLLGGGSDFGRAEGVDLDTGWHYLAGTVSGGQARVYVDGIDETTDSTIGTLQASAQPLTIGRHSQGGSYFAGALDEVRISSAMRSAGWIAAQYRSMTDTLLSYHPAEMLNPLSAKTALLLYPQTSLITLTSNPPGLALVISGDSGPAPYQREVIAGGTVLVAAIAPQVVDGERYTFVSWSDGGAQNHLIQAEDAEYTLSATFVDACDGLCDIGGGDADVDGDCEVDFQDMQIVMTGLGTWIEATHGAGDVNQDDAVDMTDLALGQRIYGAACSAE